MLNHLKRIILLFTIFLVFWGINQNDTFAAGGTEVVSRCTEAAVDHMVKGFSILYVDTDATYLKQGATLRIIRNFYKGNYYKFLACKDNSLIDLGLMIYDKTGRRLTVNAKKKNPKLAFFPPRTGKYYIKIKSYRGTGYFALLILTK